MTRDIYDCLYCGLQFKEDERGSSEGESAKHYGQELKASRPLSYLLLVVLCHHCQERIHLEQRHGPEKIHIPEIQFYLSYAHAHFTFFTLGISSEKKIHDTMWVKFCDGRSPRTYPYVSEISSDIGAIRFVTRHPTTTRFINASITGQQSRSPTWKVGYTKRKSSRTFASTSIKFFLLVLLDVRGRGNPLHYIWLYLLWSER